MRRLSLVCAFLLLCLTLRAQKIKKVSGTYIYVIPETESLQQAKATAIQRAQIQILADTFGTVLDMSAMTTMSDMGPSTMALSQSNVKGEWIETVGTPRITTIYEKEQVALKVEISGKVREIISASVNFSANVLCGIPDPRFQSEEFQNGDALYLWFQPPEDGWLAVYLYDGQDDVYCLLPYQKQGVGAYKVRAGQSYLFFSAEQADETILSDWVDEYYLTADAPMEINRIYAIYSPNRFTRALDKEGQVRGDILLPRELQFSDFQKWLSRIRSEDRMLGVKTFDITIQN